MPSTSCLAWSSRSAFIRTTCGSYRAPPRVVYGQAVQRIKASLPENGGLL